MGLWQLILVVGCRWEVVHDSATDTEAPSDSASDTGPLLVDEVCDGVDNDGDGAVDEGYDLEDADGDGSPACFDCDETDPLVGGLAVEFCDGQDNDCDGLTDEGWDDDGDGWATCLGDCDDSEPTTYPGAQELCDGLDNDCDAASVETDDLDGDGFTRCDGDCDETDTAVNPGATESCNGQDDDCDGSFDDAPECFGCTEVDDWLVCQTAGPQATAAQACAGMDLRLAVLDSEERNAAAVAATLTLTSEVLWIGATDAETEGTWLWPDGSEVSWANWADYQPDNYDDGEHCAVIHWHGVTDGRWNDVSCDYWAGFVCGT